MAEGWGLHPLGWVPSCTLSGAWQMAVDAWLLERVISGAWSGPLLRFYRWSRPTLSLGKHQRWLDPRWSRLAAEGRLDLTRRPTGGSAVLHGGDLTYALIWPDPPRRRREAYHLSCRWLQKAFSAMGQPLVFGDSPCRPDQANCFASATAADLVHPGGLKRVGSAQLWKGRRLLQHGSVAIDPPAELWEAVFGTRAPHFPPLPLSGPDLEAHLLAHASREVGASAPVPLPLRPWEWRALASTVVRYEARGLTDQVSGASAMALATGSSANPKG